MINDKIGMKGMVHYVLRDKNGNVKEEGYDTNTVTELFDAHVADQMSDSTDAQIGFMALGSGTGQTSASTDVANYVTESLIALSGTATQGEGAADNDVVYSAFWDAGAATSVITEAGIFLGSATSRADLMSYDDSLNITKGASDTLKIDWTLTWGAS